MSKNLNHERAELLRKFIRTMDGDLVLRAIDNGTIPRYLSSSEVFRIVNEERKDILNGNSNYMVFLSDILSSYKFKADMKSESMLQTDVFLENIKYVHEDVKKYFWYAFKHRNSRRNWLTDIGELRRFLIIRDTMPEVMDEKELKIDYLNPSHIEPFMLSIIIKEDMKKYPELVDLTYSKFRKYNNRRSYNNRVILEELERIDRRIPLSNIEEEFKKAFELGFIEKETLDKWQRCIIEHNL